MDAKEQFNNQAKFYSSSKTFFKVSISEISIISSARLTSIISEIADNKTELEVAGS